MPSWSIFHIRHAHWPSGAAILTDLYQLCSNWSNLLLSHHRAFQVIIYQQNESISKHKKDPSFIFTPRAHLIWAQPVLIQHIICGTVVPLSGVLYLRVPAAESSAVQMGSRTCYSLGMEICARAWNNNTNVYIRSLFLLTPSFCKRYNGFSRAAPVMHVYCELW